MDEKGTQPGDPSASQSTIKTVTPSNSRSPANSRRSPSEHKATNSLGEQGSATISSSQDELSKKESAAEGGNRRSNESRRTLPASIKIGGKQENPVPEPLSDRAPFGHKKDTSLDGNGSSESAPDGGPNGSALDGSGSSDGERDGEKSSGPPTPNRASDSASENDFEVQETRHQQADGSLISAPVQNSNSKNHFENGVKGEEKRFEHSRRKAHSRRQQRRTDNATARNKSVWQKTGWKLDRLFPVMHPLTNVMAVENMVFGLLVIYSLFSSTYQVAFNQRPEGAWLIVEILVNVAFYADCCLQFRVGYFGGSKLPPSARKRIIELGGTVPDVIMDGKKVAWRYFTTWFIVDFTSSFPFEALKSVEASRPSGIKLLMLLKFLRLPRFMAARDQVRRYLGQNLDELFSTLTTLTGIYFYCHASGCVFWYIVTRERSPNTFALQSQWDDAGTLKPLSVAPPGVAYITVLYFCIISVTSVGYGDLEPGPTIPERLWAIFNATGAALCLGYVVGKITSVVSTKRARQFQLRERFEVLQRVIEREQVPEMLVTRMTQHLASIWERSIYRYNEDELGNELPPKIRAELAATWWLRVIKPSPFFPHDFSYLRTILIPSELQLCPPSDYIVHEGQVSKHVYVVRKGRAMISSSKAVQRDAPSEDLAEDTEGQWHNEEMHTARKPRRSRRGRMKRSLTDKCTQVSKWLKKVKHRGDQSGESSSDSEDARGSEDDKGDPSDQRGKKRWVVGAGTVIGERALLNAMAKRAREVGNTDDWDQIKPMSVVMDVTAKSIAESQVISIPIEDLVIGDFPPLLSELKDALKRCEYAAPGFVENGDSDK